MSHCPECAALLTALESERARRERAERREKLLAQVALEAIRVLYHRPQPDKCGECGLGPYGDLRTALADAFGKPWELIWGNDANVDAERWDAELNARAGNPPSPPSAANEEGGDG